MIVDCVVCSKDFLISDTKGINYMPLVCSERCFVEFVNNYSANSQNIYECYTKENKHFRSKWEEIVYYKMKELFGEVKYEPFVLERLYIPDFYLPSKNLFVEIKGRWNSYTKFTAMAQKYPIILLNREFLKRVRWIL